MRKLRVTASLVLTRILRRLWDEGHLLDVGYLEEAYFPYEGTVHVRACSATTHELEWRTAYWDEDWYVYEDEDWDIEGR